MPDEQLTSVEGMSPHEINQALKAGRLDVMLGAAAGRPPQNPGTQKDKAWVKAASDAQVHAALINGDLRDLLDDPELEMSVAEAEPEPGDSGAEE